MSILQVAIFILIALQAACTGPRAYTDQEQAALTQTKTIWVDVRSDSRTLPPSIAGIIDKVEQDVKDKLSRAGLTVVPDRSTADAVLHLAFEFSDRRQRDEFSSSSESPYPQNAHFIRIGAGLDHKEVGNVFWHRDSVSSPYDVNIANSPLISSIDSKVLRTLFKSMPSAAKKE